jgi:hypothetical protein
MRQFMRKEERSFFRSSTAEGSAFPSGSKACSLGVPLQSKYENRSEDFLESVTQFQRR